MSQAIKHDTNETPTIDRILSDLKIVRPQVDKLENENQHLRRFQSFVARKHPEIIDEWLGAKNE